MTRTDRKPTAGRRSGGLAPELAIDRSSPVPLYFQIAEELKRQIQDGRLSPRTMLGNEIQLADGLAVSRPTFRKAIEQLVELGIVARRRGVGTVVLPQRVQRRLAVPSLWQDLQGSGRSPSTQVLDIRQMPAPRAVADSLEVPEGTKVLCLSRLRLAEESPIAVMKNYLPVGIINPTEEQLMRRSLYDLLQSAGTRFHIVNQTIGARVATSSEARLLNINRRGIVFTLDAHAYDVTGRAVDYGTHAYRADLYSFEISHVM